MRKLLYCLLLLMPLVSGAHEMRPGYLQITEMPAGDYNVLWKVPAMGDGLRLGLRLKFEDDVIIAGEPVSGFINNAHVQRMTISRDGGLTGSMITIDGLETTYTDVLLRLERIDGNTITHRLTPATPTYVIEAEPGSWQVAWTYFSLGVEHILSGIDHLLFVLVLILIVVGWKKLLATITAFTVAHSITLAIASLGLVRVPGPPVEAVIALSILFVAAEIIHGRGGKPGLTAKYPWVVAFTFGLLHGFGFAGALSEIGLPQSAIPLALFTFNVGVEAGQLMFVGAVLLLGFLGRRIVINPPEWAWLAPTYAIGGMAAYWVIERVVSFWA